jgi:tRNA-splicing endonuclease subunit Sen15
MSLYVFESRVGSQRNVPCSLMCHGRINSAFEDMGDVSELYMAITAEDSSILYYKLSKGFVKPQL